MQEKLTLRLTFNPCFEQPGPALYKKQYRLTNCFLKIDFK